MAICNPYLFGRPHGTLIHFHLYPALPRWAKLGRRCAAGSEIPTPHTSQRLSGGGPSCSHLPGFTGFNVCLQPSHACFPAFVVARDLVGMASKAGVFHANQRAGANTVRAAGMEFANVLRFELPADDSVEWADEIRLSRVDEQARRFDFEILAFHVEGLAGWTYSFVRPLAAGSQIRRRTGDMKVAFHAPPLCALVDVSDGFEDAGRRSGNEDLRQDCVLVGSKLCSGHLVVSGAKPRSLELCERAVKDGSLPLPARSLRPLGENAGVWDDAIALPSGANSLSALGVSLQPNQSQTPAVRMRLRGFGVACKSGMREFQRGAAIVRFELPQNFGGVWQPT